jgi:putative transposase
MAKMQTLSFPIRLPDAMQEEALRLLDASRTAINAIITELWPQLDLLAADRSGPAWKSVEKHLLVRSGHGNRQERNEMEQAGRILRAQATRKRLFALILPLLTTGLIIPAQGRRPARKDHRAIREQVRALQQQLKEAGDDAESFIALTNLLEQACNRFLKEEPFPTTYEDLQDIPVLSVGHITFAGDDGMTRGQTYRASVELVTVCNLSTHQEETHTGLWLKLRTPDAAGKWRWGMWSSEIRLAQNVQAYLEQGARPQAPTLREVRGFDGSRYAVLDLILDVPAQYVTPLEQEKRVLGFDWGIRSLITVSILQRPDAPDEPYQQISRPVFLDTGGIDGRQARLRREIDRLKACKDRYQELIKAADSAREEQGTPRPTHYEGWKQHMSDYETRIKQCWNTYERRNKELAHLASNLLILLATLYNCRLIVGENLTTLKTIGRGRGVRGRFRNRRNNSQVRGEVWRCLSYKCYLAGIRTRTVEPRGTTHTCPHCLRPARTFASPAASDRRSSQGWGPWLCCEHPDCLWNGARDYAASLNIAALGMAFLVHFCETSAYRGFRMTSKEVKPFSYSGQGAAPLLRPQGITPRPKEGKHVYYAGWSYTLRLCMSQSNPTLSWLCTSQYRKRLLKSA